MNADWLPVYGRPGHRVEKALAALFLVLFLYALVDWLGWLPFERGFQPLRMLLLSTALLLQPVAALILPRARRFAYSLLAISMGLIVATFVVAS